MQRKLKDMVEVFSALSAPVRMQILRLLATRGPQTYSEIMDHLDFKPSRDAGKFVYHLKTLVSAGLIALDKESRRYRITDLGEMVNSFFQELTEYSLRRSGRLLVRTSRYAIEEFDRNRITASLVEEAGVPPDLADKVSAEVEERLLQLPIRYLTAPLIRELVNAVLIEQGLEEYRHKLTRLGMPVHDVTLTLRAAAEKKFNPAQVYEQAGSQVLTEYVLLEVLPREVADAHLSGQIHLSHVGDWPLRLETVHHDLRGFLSGVFKPLSPLTPETSPPETFSQALALTIGVVEGFAPEVSSGQVLEYFNVFLAPWLRGVSAERAAGLVESFLQALSYAADGKPVTLGLELSIPEHLQETPVGDGRGEYGSYEGEARKLLTMVLEGLLNLSRWKPPLNIYPVVKVRPEQAGRGHLLESLHELASKWGLLYVANLPLGEASYTADGLCLAVDWSGEWEADLLRCGCLGMATLNLPRASYDSRGGRERFLEKLSESFSLALKALEVKAKAVERALSGGLLPNLSQQGRGEAYLRVKASPWTVSLIGLNETVKAQTGYWPGEETVAQHFTVEILEFLGALAGREAEAREARISLSHISDDNASQRLPLLDVERYGWSRVVARGSREAPYYSHVPLTVEELDVETRVNVEAKLQPLLGGGHLTLIPANGKPAKTLARQTGSLCEAGLRFFTYDQPLSHCPICGKTFQGFKVKCAGCGSLQVEVYARQSTRYLPLRWWNVKGRIEALKRQHA